MHECKHKEQSAIIQCEIKIQSHKSCHGSTNCYITIPFIELLSVKKRLNEIKIHTSLPYLELLIHYRCPTKIILLECERVQKMCVVYSDDF
jgi:hypothetical protein